MIRRLTAAAAGLLITASIAWLPAGAVAASSLPRAPAASAPLTNLAHLDFLNANGTVNLNSGAESTIFGLLTREALDANPGVAATALASAHLAPAGPSPRATTSKDANGASPSARTRPSPCQCPPADSPSCSASPRTQAGTA